MLKRIAWAVTAAIALSALAHATAQMGDILIIDGKEHSIVSNPLRPYIENHPNCIPESKVYSTALWRGYVATWTVKDERLLLTDIKIMRSKKSTDGGFDTEFASAIDQVFPGQKEVVASWYTGHIIVPNGKLVKYVHMGYASTFENYIVLRVESGVVKRMWRLNAKGFEAFRDAQFAKYKKTDEYQRHLAEAIADDEKEGKKADRKQREEFDREFYSEEYTSMIFD